MNKLTLIVDFNWLAISRMSVLAKDFNIKNPEATRQWAYNNLQDLLAKSINVVLNRFPIIDNIVIVSDAGSWRKRLKQPQIIKDTIYKGNREFTSELDWDLIYKSFNDSFNQYKNTGITCTKVFECEGDDWVWYWSQKLNKEGINCLIWSSDNDLKQLISKNPDNNTFTAWYNDKNGLWVDSSFDKDFDIMGYFLHPENTQQVFEGLKNKVKQISYINPQTIILNKILCGDSGDNIQAIVKYTKNGRTYRFSQKDYEKLINDLNINTIDDLINSYERISEYIINMKKYRPYKFIKENLIEMLKYNTKLVWLDKDIIPEDIQISMSKNEYKEFNVDDIRHNYKVLLKDDENILNIFEEI